MDYLNPTPVFNQLPPDGHWTREEFERAGEAGVFGASERLELIEGEVFRKATPQTCSHATAVSLAAATLQSEFRPDSHVRTQLPLALGDHSEPEPDIAVVQGSIRDFAQAHPTTALLVVEISDTTLKLDRSVKSGLYARAGIAEYWIVNLIDRVVEVHREPAEMADDAFGYQYRSVTRHIEGETLSPTFANNTQIGVADLLP